MRFGISMRTFALCVVCVLLLDGPNQAQQTQKIPTAALEAPQNPQASALQSPQVNLVRIVFTARDRGNRIITDLHSDEVRLTENGQERQIALFAGEAPQPLRIVLMLDTSNSRRISLPGVEREPAIKLFKRVIRKNDLAMVAVFDNKPRLIRDFGEDQNDLAQAITLAARTPFGGATGLYDSLLWAIQDKLSGQTGRRAVVLTSDGSDSLSKKGYTDVLEAAQGTNTAIYFVGLSTQFGNSLTRSMLPDVSPEFISRNIPEQTGGRSFLVHNHAEMSLAFEAIADELSHFYVLGFSPPGDTSDGKYRQVQLETKRKGVKLFLQKGYYAPRR